MIDKMGRKLPIFITFVFQFPLYLAVLFTKDIQVMTALCFFLGITCVARYNGCYIAAYEFAPDKYKYSVSTVLLISESLLCIF